MFGFMAMNGKGVVRASDEAKKEDMQSFMELIRENNPKRPMGIILDNAKIHHAKIVTHLALDSEMYLIYLPPYSPDLNPIEFGNKDLKRELSKILEFDKMVEASESVALNLFEERKWSYTKDWREEFISVKSC